MKFTDGYWLKRAGLTVAHPRVVQDVERHGDDLVVYGLCRNTRERGLELDQQMVTLTLTAVAPEVLRVRVEGYQGGDRTTPDLPLHLPAAPEADIVIAEKQASISSGSLTARVELDGDYALVFESDGQQITASLPKGQGLVTTPDGTRYVHEQLLLDVGECVYGLGERFGPVVKNGQSVDLWNSDGGTASEQAYKNVPFYLTSAGYGVFVNDSGLVSFEVGSEVNSRVQFSVEGEYLEYFVINGPSPKDVLDRYTALTGRPPQVPDWSYGLWLSTSFTTDYSEQTVLGFVERMRELDIPLSVLHFDCYWMRASHWCDFVWDPAMFPDPEGMLARLHEQGLKVCVWINPYIAQRSHLFAEGKAKGYLLHRPDGSVRQWDHWQSGMAWVDFTNPDAVAWWKDQLRGLLRQGVDCFKTDFGERVPTDVVWFDGSDPEEMHNYYSYLYNKAAHDVIAEERGAEEAIVFARSATAGGQAMPVHWGGDSEPTFVSMAETLRGGLSLSLSGFGYWSHDMGGFEGTPDNDVFVRWFPFGMLSSHSRLHGSRSYRVPWQYGDDAVAVAQRFTALKNRLIPYIRTHALEATRVGTPLMRHMLLEFPSDPGVRHVDTQYMFGPDLLVAPVFQRSGAVDYYLPSDGWTDILSGEHHEHSGWQQRFCDARSLPLLVPDGTLLPMSGRADRPDHDLFEDLVIHVVQPHDGLESQCVVDDGTRRVTFTARQEDGNLHLSCDQPDLSWSVAIIGGTDAVVTAEQGFDELCPSVRFPVDDPAGITIAGIQHQPIRGEHA